MTVRWDSSVLRETCLVLAPGSYSTVSRTNSSTAGVRKVHECPRFTFIALALPESQIVDVGWLYDMAAEVEETSLDIAVPSILNYR